MEERLRPSDWLGVVLVSVVGLVPILMTLLVAWWILLGGQP